MLSCRVWWCWVIIIIKRYTVIHTSLYYYICGENVLTPSQRTRARAKDETEIHAYHSSDQRRQLSFYFESGLLREPTEHDSISKGEIIFQKYSPKIINCVFPLKCFGFSGVLLWLWGSNNWDNAYSIYVHFHFSPTQYAISLMCRRFLLLFLLFLNSFQSPRENKAPVSILWVDSPKKQQFRGIRYKYNGNFAFFHVCVCACVIKQLKAHCHHRWQHKHHADHNPGNIFQRLPLNLKTKPASTWLSCVQRDSISIVWRKAKWAIKDYFNIHLSFSLSVVHSLARIHKYNASETSDSKRWDERVIIFCKAYVIFAVRMHIDIHRIIIFIPL